MQRSNPIIRSLMQPLVVKGCGYEWLQMDLLISFSVLVMGVISGYRGTGLLLSVGLFFILFLAGSRITAYDPQLIPALFCSANHYKIIDPKKFSERKPIR